MKKNIKVIISTIAVIILIISAGYYVYTEIIAKSFRYESPTESFEKTGPKEAELLDILEDKDVALVTYRRKDGVLSYKLIAKDNRGWAPMTVNYRNMHHRMNKIGFSDIKKVEDKYVVIISASSLSDGILPITDSLGSAFYIKTYDANGGGKVTYGFLVSEEEFPKDYKVIIGDEEIAMY